MWGHLVLCCCVGVVAAACEQQPPHWLKGRWTSRWGAKPVDPPLLLPSGQIFSSGKCVIGAECVPRETTPYNMWEAKNPKLHVRPEGRVTKPGVITSSNNSCKAEQPINDICEYCTDRIDCGAQGLDAQTRRQNCCIP
jgi:hypothetical protein